MSYCDTIYFMTNPDHIGERRRLQTLSEFRYALRQFLQFSEQRALDAGLHPQQHQLLLHIAGVPDGVEATVSYVAERLGLRHNSVVELSKRCEEAGLIRRKVAESDRRFVVLKLTSQGLRVIQTLAMDHERELSELVPTLIRSLTQIRRHSRTACVSTSRAGRRNEFNAGR
jgi:DNA-binding MarR family transcriptional regulator